MKAALSTVIFINWKEYAEEEKVFDMIKAMRAIRRTLIRIGGFDLFLRRKRNVKHVKCVS